MTPLRLSTRAQWTKDQPISYFMQHALENPNLISLAAGFVDAESLPADDTRVILDAILSDEQTAREALQYGTTQGHGPLREKILAHCLQLDGVKASDVALGVDDVIVTTGSQQLLYLLGEALFDPGDIVITEAPSYFVYHGCLNSLGVRTMSVPMDAEGMDTHALEELLLRLEKTGELERVRLIYTVDYFQNPTGLTLSLPRRRHLLELARRFSRKHRLLILEDAAYRELKFAGDDVPSIKSLDKDNRHVILTMTFSKPWAPGLKTGYGVMPRDLVRTVLRFKGNHDFGSSNFNQVLLDHVLASGAYPRHVAQLCDIYRHKRDTLIEALQEAFPDAKNQGLSWTQPRGGMYVWLSCPPEMATGPDSPFMQGCMREGVLYVPGQFCYVGDDGQLPDTEARLCYGVATPEQLREAGIRLGRAARDAGLLLGHALVG